MKKLIIFLLIVFSLNASAKKNQYQYRLAPKTGELICIGSLIGGAIGASEIFGHENKLNNPIIYASILTGCVGVAIDINCHNTKIKYKHKVKTSVFGHRNTFGIRVKF